MKVLIDANVLFPTVLREIVLGVADKGYFEPLWSERILEEWRRATVRIGEGEIGEFEVAAARRRFPNAVVQVSAETRDDVTLPDPDDEHVLAAAIDANADELLTMNLRDFPTNALAPYGIVRRDPDGFLLEAFHMDNELVEGVVASVLRTAGTHGIDVSSPRRVLKRARLPRLGKALHAH